MPSPLRLPLLANSPTSPFPPVETALREPDGLLAIGGDLSSARLLNAYRHGIFPWFSDGDPILWWSPNPRMVFSTHQIHLSTRFRRKLRHCHWKVRADTCFSQVMAQCANSPRPGQDGTWITQAMHDAYIHLHQLGHAHSIEVFDDNQLVGGLYGIAIGKMFFGESMFSAVSGGSQVALAALGLRLHQWGYPLIDAQVESPHLVRMGAKLWPRQDFITAIASLTATPTLIGHWQTNFSPIFAFELA